MEYTCSDCEEQFSLDHIPERLRHHTHLCIGHLLEHFRVMAGESDEECTECRKFWQGAKGSLRDVVATLERLV